MQPKWILYSMTAVGLIIGILTNIVQDTSGTFPPWVMSAINIALPSLVLLRRYFGDAAAGLGQPPITLLPCERNCHCRPSSIERSALTSTISDSM